MTTKQLRANLTADTRITVAPTVNLTLEQENIGGDEVNLRDVFNMWQYARSGQSARTYNPYGCNVAISNTSVSFTIGFFVWPLPLELPYSLSTSIGDIDSGAYFELDRNISVLFPLSDSVSLDRVFSNLEYQWLTGVYDKSGRSIPPPEIIQDLGNLTIPGPYFGEARVQFVEKGYMHELTVSIDTVDENGENIQVEDLTIAITASWVNSDGELQLTVLDLVVPECVKAALVMCKQKPNLICRECGELILEVYYNVCNGDVIGARRVRVGGQGHWCSVA